MCTNFMVSIQLLLKDFVYNIKCQHMGVLEEKSGDYQGQRIHPLETWMSVQDFMAIH